MSSDLPAEVEEQLEDMGVPVPQPIEPETSFQVLEGDAAQDFLKNLGIPFEILFPTPAFSNEEKTGESLFHGVREDQRVGINPKDALGMKKPNLALVPPAATLHTASAMMDGAAKYGPYNWRDNAVQLMVYIAAAQRHLFQLLDGEDFDPTSKVHHAAHASACMAIILDAFETGNLVDDRPTAGVAGNMIRTWNEETKFQ